MSCPGPCAIVPTVRDVLGGVADTHAMADFSRPTVRLVRKTFKAEDVPQALMWLYTYGHWSSEKTNRVHEAIVKLSRGDVEALRYYVDVARKDRRYVLSLADEPPDHEADPTG